MTRQGLAGGVSLQLEPLQTTEAHAYWRVFLSGRTDLPTGDLKIHLCRYLGLTPEEQRSHCSAKKEGRIIGSLRLGPAEISGFSIDPSFAPETATVLLKAVDLLRAGGATAIVAHFEDRYEPAFVSLGFRRVFARIRMEAPTRKAPPPEGLTLQPPEEDEVLGLTQFFVDAYEGHIEQQFGMHTGSDEEWRGYVGGLFKGDSGQYLPDASYVALEGDRIVGAILVTHWMGMPLVAESRIARPLHRAGRSMRPGMDRAPGGAVTTIIPRRRGGRAARRQRSLSTTGLMCPQPRYATLNRAASIISSRL